MRHRLGQKFKGKNKNIKYMPQTSCDSGNNLLYIFHYSVVNNSNTPEPILTVFGTLF